MAVTKIHPIKVTLNKALAYICNPDKTDDKMLVSSYGCSHETADIEFGFTLAQARDRGDNLAHHLIQAFAPGEVSIEEAHRIGQELADKVLGGKYEYVLTTHIDKGHLHNHIIFCAANFVDYRKYNSNSRTYYQIRKESDRLCREHNLSVVEPGQDKGKQYAEWNAERQGASWKAKLKAVIDDAVRRAGDFDDFLRLMEGAGYEIKKGEYLSFRAPGQERFTRSKAKVLGEAYTETAIRERIAGNYRAEVKAVKQGDGISLLIDIENSIKAAESRGYEQWAKIHNLKQAAKTMNFLTEHNITGYEQLPVLTDIHTENEQAVTELKEVEKRLSDMALLIKAISAYRKTKPVHDAYLKAADQDGFFREHESSLIIYDATVQTLRAAGKSVQLPNIKKLQAEYGQLSEQKDKLYTAYGKLKKKVKQYEAIRHNVDGILKRENPSIQKDVDI